MGHKQTMFASQPKAIGFLLLAASAAVIAYSDTMVSPPFAEHLRVEESLKAEPKQSCTAKLPLPAQPSKFSQALKKTPLKCGIKGEQTSASTHFPTQSFGGCLLPQRGCRGTPNVHGQ